MFAPHSPKTLAELVVPSCIASSTLKPRIIAQVKPEPNASPAPVLSTNFGSLTIPAEAGIVKEPKFVDRTGAGDAFGSGFTCAIMRGLSVEDAIQLGTTNSASVLGEWGANMGVLTRQDSIDKFGKVSIIKTRLV